MEMLSCYAHVTNFPPGLNLQQMAIPLGSTRLRGDGERKACGLGFLQTAGEQGIMKDLKCDTRCIFDIYRDFCAFRGSPSHAKAEV